MQGNLGTNNPTVADEDESMAFTEQTYESTHDDKEENPDPPSESVDGAPVPSETKSAVQPEPQPDPTTSFWFKNPFGSSRQEPAANAHAAGVPKKNPPVPQYVNAAAPVPQFVGSEDVTRGIQEMGMREASDPVARATENGKRRVYDAKNDVVPESPLGILDKDPRLEALPDDDDDSFPL